MVGKKNIVFGFLYLVLTAALGPYMVKTLFPDIRQAAAERQQAMAELQLLASNDFERDLEAVPAADLARDNARALLGLNRHLQAESRLGDIKGGPHAHGNLEALLNIAAGVALVFVAAAGWLKQLVSWLFILGALLHSGVLYLAIVFELGWAQQLLGLGIGPVLLLAALLLMGLVAITGWRGEPVQDG